MGIVIIFLIRAVWNSYTEAHRANEQVQQTQKRFDLLSSKANQLSQSIGSLKTEEGVEKEIRTKFSVAKEGEKVVIIIDSSTSTQKTVKVEEKGFFRRIWDKIKGIF